MDARVTLQLRERQSVDERAKQFEIRYSVIEIERRTDDEEDEEIEGLRLVKISLS